jgi:tRNA (cmo5U34)-methyltransferase
VDIRSVFDQAAQSYDRARRQLVPCFDDFYGTVLDLIPFATDSAIRVLDLGAGTGLLSALIAERFPRAHLTLIDISEGMLDQARQRFVADAARFDFRVLDLAEAPLSGRYEAVVSALAIHHVNDEGKQRLFQGVYDVLSDGGVFVNADQVLGMTPEIDEEYKAAWLRQVRERGVGEGDLAAALERMEEDEMSTLGLQMKYLEETGFGMVDSWYKNYGFVVYAGRKRGTAQRGRLPPTLQSSR